MTAAIIPTETFSAESRAMKSSRTAEVPAKHTVWPYVPERGGHVQAAICCWLNGDGFCDQADLSPPCQASASASQMALTAGSAGLGFSFRARRRSLSYPRKAG